MSGMRARWNVCPRWARRLVTSLAVVLALVAALAIALSPWLSRVARTHLVESLERRFDSHVELSRLDIRLVPWPRAHGEELTITPTDRPQGAPPLVRVKAFTVTAGYLGFFRLPVRVNHVDVDGAEIIILPRRRRGDATPAGEQAHGETTARRVREEEEEQQQPSGGDEAPSARGDDESDDDEGDRVHVTRIDARNVQLRLVPRRAGKSDRVFDISRVVLRSVRRHEPLEYEARLSNPIPRGDVAATGAFGPWNADEAGQTPVSGRFTFNNADLDAIKGLKGILDAHGDFAGVLERIAVRGETSTPAFGLSTSDQRLALTTRFDATVDGTNGETLLNDVEARLGDTMIASTGKVSDKQGGKGREVVVTARIADGRLEDVMRLAMKGERPLMRGRLDVTTRVVVAPGKDDVVDRLLIDANVTIAEARFSDPKVQRKVNEFSARAEGDAETARAAARGPAVATAVTAAVTVRDGVIRMAPVKARIDGAMVTLNGSYGLHNEVLDLAGTAVLDARVSQTTTGWKSWLLKLADPLFGKKGGGSAVPITIKGTRDDPKVGVDLKRAITRRR